MPPPSPTLHPISLLLLELLGVLGVLLLVLVLHHPSHGREHGLLLLYELHLLVEHCILLYLMEAHGREDHHGVVLLLLVLVLVLLVLRDVRVDARGVHAIPHLAPHIPSAATAAAITGIGELLLEVMVVGGVHGSIPIAVATTTIGWHSQGG